MKKLTRSLNLAIVLMTTVSVGFSPVANAADPLNGIGAPGKSGKDGLTFPGGVRPNPRGDVNHLKQCQTTPGRSGSNGGKGGRGSRGTDFDLQMRDTGHILITGTAVNSDLGVANTVNQQTEITGVVQIMSNGGRGGLPGSGGDGEGAQQGQDSKQHSTNEIMNGGDGCPAGSAGNGGDSGKPGDGGDAGNIRVRISSDDTHLLLATKVEVTGGAPGERLQGGSAGQLASGGDGGKGYYDDRSGNYWTGQMMDEPGCTPRSAGYYPTGRYVDESGCTPTSGHYEDGGQSCGWVDSVVNDIETSSYECTDNPDDYVSGTTCSQVAETEYLSAIACNQVKRMEYRTVIVTTPDGKKGSNSQHAQPGADSPSTAVYGKNGIAMFEVEDAVTHKLTRYAPGELMNLEMISYNLVDQDNNGVFEPGEVVQLKNLKIRNNGKMPYRFSKAQTLVFLKNTNWLVTDPQSLEIPKIEAKSTVTIANPGLSFTIKANSFQANSTAPNWTETIVPHNRITRIERQWNGLKLEKSFYITFPVRLTSFAVPASIQAGQTVPVSWSIENLSNQAIPKLGAAARTVTTQVGFAGQNLSPDQIQLSASGQGAQNFNSDLSYLISGLGAHETRVVQGQLSIADSAEPYSTGTLNLGLKINQLNSSLMTEVQNLNTEIRVTRVYKTRSDDDALLVLADSNLEIFRAWTKLFQRLGIKGNIWDLTIDGSFSFFGALNDGGSLSSDFKNKSVILPTLFDQGKISQAGFTQAHSELFRAASESSNSLYMIGYRTVDFQALLQKGLQPGNAIEHKSVDEFFAAVKGGFKSPATEVHAVQVEESYLFVRTPRMDKMLEVKSEIEARLKTELPGQNFIVSVDFKPQQTGSGIKATYLLGRVLVRSGIGNDKAKLVLLPLNNGNPNAANFILGVDNTRALCLSLNPQARLKAVAATVNNAQQDGRSLRAVLECVQHDIYQEWLQSKNQNRSKYYLDYIRQLGPKASSAARTELLGFTAMLLTMAEIGLEGDVKNQSVQIVNSTLVNGLNASEVSKMNVAKAKLQTEIRDAASKSKTSLTSMARASILKSINPRAQTSGIDSDDIGK